MQLFFGAKVSKCKRKLIWDFKHNPLTADNQILDKIVCRVSVFLNLIGMTSVPNQPQTSPPITALDQDL